VHHLCSRIPYHRLPEVLRDHPGLRDIGRLTLWDQRQGRLISFQEMDKLYR
jgi:omega-6 fatty acid desaturase (delta-12 desaturase)